MITQVSILIFILKHDIYQEELCLKKFEKSFYC